MIPITRKIIEFILMIIVLKFFFSRQDGENLGTLSIGHPFSKPTRNNDIHG